MLAVSALDIECCSFRRKSRGANDNAGYADEVRYIGRVKIADGDLRDG